MHETLRSFNRDTGWLATGVLGSVLFAAVVVAVQILEHQKDAINLPVEATLLGVDHALTKIYPPFPQMGAAESSTPDPALNSDISHQNVQANANPLISSLQQAPAQAKGQKISIARSKSSKRPRVVDVKKRLIELWHQSLARSEKTRSWGLFSSPNKRDTKKVSYTAETNQ